MCVVKLGVAGNHGNGERAVPKREVAHRKSKRSTWEEKHSKSRNSGTRYRPDDTGLKDHINKC